MSYRRSLIVIFLASQSIAVAGFASERSSLHNWPAVASGQRNWDQNTIKNTPTGTDPLDRVATAVDSAESSHGRDIRMWRPDPSGPQGPMQVSEAAAADVGGGDRFDLIQNRAIGRAYLALLFGRYRNWPDAIAAYNWGLGKMDAWVKAGRPPDKFLVGVAVYLRRVLDESRLCDGPATAHIQHPPGNDASAAPSSPATRNPSGDLEPTGEPVILSPASFTNAACSTPKGGVGAGRLGVEPSRFFKKLDQAMQLALQHAQRGL
jgi:hypothetical protein